MTAATVPYDWIKEMPRSLLERDGVPLFGHAPPFPWDLFQKNINNLFQTENLSLHPRAAEWRSPQELTEGIDQPVILSFNVEPMSGPVYWLLSKNDVSCLMSWLLTHSTTPAKTIQEPSFQEGFYQFLAIECCHLISISQFDKTLTPKLIAEQPLPDATLLSIDVGIGYQNQELRGRLILSEEFYHSWKEYYANRNVSISISNALAEKIKLTVRLEAGRVNLTQAEWNQVNPGDFLVLDFCSIQPPNNKGRVILVVNGIPLFRGKYKKGDLKILELPLFYEEDVPMATRKPDEESENIDESFTESSEMSFFDDVTDDSHFDETTTDDHTHTDNTTEIATDDHTHTDDHSEIATEDKTTSDTTIEEATEEPTSDTTTDNPIEAKKVDLNEIPLTLKIEVGRLQMSVKKLLEIQPGNMLEIDVHPEDGVDLVINGTCIGKGELIRIGEMLGVRVLDLIS